MADERKSKKTLGLENNAAKIEASRPQSFQFQRPTSAIQNEQKLNALRNPGEWNGGQWAQSVNDAMNKILNGEKFSYDLNGDALWRQYKDPYTTQGKMAMMDTMGQAAALNGGYGSSYAQSAGQQAYQGYLQQLNDKVPELYQLALNKYNSDRQDLYQQYSMLADREATDYAIYRDSVGDYRDQRDYLTDAIRYDDETAYTRQFGEYTQGYNEWQNALNRADNLAANSLNRDDSVFEANRNFNFNEQESAKNEVYSLLQSGVEPPADILAKAGISSATAKKLLTVARQTQNAGMQGYKSMSSAELVEHLNGFKADGDNAGLAAFLDDCVAAGRLSESAADEYYKKYLTEEKPPQGNASWGNFRLQGF